MDAQLTAAVEKQIREIVDQSDVKDLADILLPWLSEISLPNDQGQELLDTLMQGLAKAQELKVDTAMRVAFLLGAAWQKACDVSGE